MPENLLTSAVASGSVRRTEEKTLRLRARVPAVVAGETYGWKFFDAPSGTQMIDGCIDALHGYLLAGTSNRQGIGPTGERTEDAIRRARSEVQHLLRADGYRVVFGQNMTSLAFATAHTVANHRARRGSSILVSELEHFGNVDPWVRNFADHGSDAVWIKVDKDTLRLQSEGFERELSARQVDLVAITLASNAIGTIPDAAPVIEAAHALGALVAVDGVQAIYDQQLDLGALQPDLFFCSSYKFYGPHLGIMLIREDLAEELKPYKVSSGTNAGAEKFETGTQNHEAIAGLVGTLDALGRLVGGSGGEGAREAIGRLAPAQSDIAAWIEAQLREMPRLRVFRPDGRAGKCAPTIAFRVDGRLPVDCAQQLRESGLILTHGTLYADALARRLGVADDGGWVRAGVAGYNTWDEAEALVEAVGDL